MLRALPAWLRQTRAVLAVGSLCLLGALGCPAEVGLRPPHAVLVIEDPAGLATEATRLQVGIEGRAPAEVSLDAPGLSSSPSITLVYDVAGSHPVVVTALDPGGGRLARGSGLVAFVTGTANPQVLELGAVCAAGADNGSPCALPGTGGRGVCVNDDCVASRCGDGFLDEGAGEECDDGNLLEDDGCRASCHLPRCGDGVLWRGVEVCDDGNTTSGDGCRSDCAGVEACGDGLLDDAAGEACDDGNLDDGDACPTGCQPARCGDGFVQTGAEACDDGNADDSDGCLSNCQRNVCGDGERFIGVEECDFGAGNSDVLPDRCRTDCTEDRCGDGVTDEDEACDFGAGNSDELADRCRSDCQAPRCGDGVVDTGEACDEGAGNDDDAPDACRTDCQAARCGDGVVDEGEACDDGNTADGDGCLSTCQPNVCGDGVLNLQAEACDDANDNPHDGCRECRLTTWAAVAEPTVGGGDEEGGPLAMSPYDLAVDPGGDLYIADEANHRVLRFREADGSVEVVAGTGVAGRGGDGVPATLSRLDRPSGVAVDGLGTLYIADRCNNRVVRVSPAGILYEVYTFAGTLPSCFADPLLGPRGVAVSGLGTLWVAHQSEHIVYRSGAGPTALVPAYGDDPADDLNFPRDVVVHDASGEVYVSDLGPTWGGRLSRLTLGGGFEELVFRDPLAGTEAPSDFFALHLDHPLLTAVDAARGELLEVEVTSGTESALSTGLLGPVGLAERGPGSWWVAESSSHLVLAITVAGPKSTALGSGVAVDIVGDGGSARALPVSPDVVLPSPDGDALFIADKLRDVVWRVELTSPRLARVILGTGVEGNANDGSPSAPEKQQLHDPSGLAVDDEGALYVADAGNRCVRRLADGAMDTVYGTCGDPQSELGVALGLLWQDGVLWVAEPSAGQVRVLDVSTSPASLVATHPVPFATDFERVNDEVIVSHRSPNLRFHRVSRVDLVAGLGPQLVEIECPKETHRVCGDCSLIPVDGGGTGSANKSVPKAEVGRTCTCNDVTTWHCERADIAVDPAAGEVYFADYARHGVRKVTGETWLDPVPGRPVVGVSGLPGLDGDGGPAADALLNGVRAVAFDALGRLWVGDNGNGRVRLVDAVGGLIDTPVGPVHPVGDGALGPSSHTGAPQSVAPAAVGGRWLYTDGIAGRVRALDLDDGSLSTVIGYASPAAGVGAYYRRPLASPGALALDPGGALYVAQRAGGSLVRFALVDETEPRTWLQEHVAGPDTDAEVTPPTLLCPFGEPEPPTLETLCLLDVGGMVFDASRQALYLSHTLRQTVRAIDFQTDPPEVREVLGEPFVAGAAGGLDPTSPPPAGEVRLFGPAGLALGKDGALLVADRGNHRVLRLDADDEGGLSASSPVRVVIGDGNAANAGQGRPARALAVHEPRGLFVDDWGNLFVAAHSGVRLVVADGDRVDGESAAVTVYGGLDDGAIDVDCLSSVFVDAVADPAGPAQSRVLAFDDCRGLLVEARDVGP